MGFLRRLVRALRQGNEAFRGDASLQPAIVAHGIGPRPSKEGYLAAAMVFRNQARFLPEWVEFHRLVGIEHFFLYDHGSHDKPGIVLAPFIDEGLVTLLPWGFHWSLLPTTTAQNLGYAHALSTFGEGWRWMALIDSDEFLFPSRNDSLREVLRDFEDLPAVLAFWTMYGKPNDQAPNRGLVIERFTMRAPFGVKTKPKSIVNPMEVVGISNPHLCDLRSGPRRGYTEDRQLYQKLEGVTKKRAVGVPVSDRLRLNHYYVRSPDDFAEKLSNVRATGWDNPTHRETKIRRYAAGIDEDAYHDENILRFVPALWERLRAIGREPMSAPAATLEADRSA